MTDETPAGASASSFRRDIPQLRPRPGATGQRDCTPGTPTPLPMSAACAAGLRVSSANGSRTAGSPAEASPATALGQALAPVIPSAGVTVRGPVADMAEQSPMAADRGRWTRPRSWGGPRPRLWVVYTPGHQVVHIGEYGRKSLAPRPTLVVVRAVDRTLASVGRVPRTTALGTPPLRLPPQLGVTVQGPVADGRERSTPTHGAVRALAKGVAHPQCDRAPGALPKAEGNMRTDQDRNAAGVAYANSPLVPRTLTLYSHDRPGRSCLRPPLPAQSMRTLNHTGSPVKLRYQLGSNQTPSERFHRLAPADWPIRTLVAGSRRRAGAELRRVRRSP